MSDRIPDPSGRPDEPVLVPPTLTMRMTVDAMSSVAWELERPVDLFEPAMVFGVASVLGISENEASVRIAAVLDWGELQSELAEGR